MSLSTTPRPSALAYFCTSALVVAASAAASDISARPARVAALELELSLAQRPEVYLLLNPAGRTLEVKIRGVTLDRVPLTGIKIITHAPVFGGRAVSPLPLPAIWRLVNGPGDTDREYIAPTELRPYNPDGYDDPPPGTPPTRPGTSPSTGTPLPEPPASYRAQLDTGYDLWITTTLPPQGFLARASAAVRDGWQRLRGRGIHLPPAITLAMAKEDAVRLHHLMRSNMAILVLAEP